MARRTSTLFRKVALGTSLALLGFAILVLWGRRESARPSASLDLDPLVEAIGAARPIEPRLTGGFQWGKFSLSPHGPGYVPTAPVRRAALRIRRGASHQPTPERLGRAATAWLLMGNATRAVELLERAIESAPDVAWLYSDLSASLLVRGRPPDANAALAWADRAIARDRSIKEAWFNRALALEKLSLIAQAKNAWGVYQALDSESDWAREARTRIRRLVDADFSAQWAAARLRLLDCDALIDVGGHVRMYSQESRELLEEELLPTWGKRYLEKDIGSATKLLVRAKGIASELRRQGNDQLPAAMLETFSSSTSRDLRLLAEGHIAYADARVLYDRLNYEEAAPLFRSSQDVLERAGSPFSAWAVLHLAIIDYQRRDIDQASALLQKIAEQANRRSYLSLASRAEWLLSLIDTSRNDFASAFIRLERARDGFQRTREAENTAAVDTIMAEQTRLMGEPTRSWEYLRRSLAVLPRVRRFSRKQAILLTAAHTSLREQLPESALYYQHAFIEPAHESGAAVAEAEGYLHRAKVYRELANDRAVRDDLVRARELLGKAEGHPLRNLIEPQILIAEADVIGNYRPSEAASKLRQALGQFEKGYRSVFLPITYLKLARVDRRLGDLTGAEKALDRGLAVFEYQQQSLKGSPLRVSFFDEGWDLFEEMLELQIARGRPDAAFLVAEQGRSRILSELCLSKKPVLSLSAIAGKVMQGGALVEFAVTTKRWMAWVITPQGSYFVERNTPATRLEQLVNAYQPVAEGGKDSESDEALVALHDELIMPLQKYLPETGPLVIVPDAILRLVPFAALRDSESGQFLVERHEIIMAPSAALALREGVPIQSIPHSALVIGNPAIRRSAHPDVVPLKGAEEEAREVALQYKQVTLLTSSDATRARVLDGLWKSNVVHFAGHALPNSEYPGLASLLLATDEGGKDTILAHELETLGCGRSSVPQLVVLAGCATAGGHNYRGEGVLSLVRPFLAAGVAAVVASYWSVEDQASREFLVRVHLSYRMSGSAATALREAQLDAVRSGKPVSLWGAFAVYGVVPAQR